MYRQLFVCALLVLTSLQSTASPWSEKIKLEVDEKVRQNFQNRSQVGIVVGVMKGSETHVWSYGESNVHGGGPLSGDTIFEMGSITKTFTAALLALEVNRGRVRINDTVQSLWPELQETDAGKITLEQLATHTSGLPAMPLNLEAVDPLNPAKDYDATKLFEFLKSFKRPQSAKYNYSNVGFGLLGFLLSEKLNKKSFEDYLTESLLKPLSLTDTKISLAAHDFKRVAQGYGAFYNLMPLWDFNVLQAAGALKTTVNDLLKYAKANMALDSSEMGKALSLSHTPRFNADSVDVQVGLAWHLLKIGNYSVVSHGGTTGGYKASLYFDPDKQLAVVVLSNTAIAPVCVMAPIFEIACDVPQEAKVDPTLQQKFVGTYESTWPPMQVKVSVENGILGVAIPGQPKQRLWATSNYEYVIPDLGNARVKFTTGTGDQVESVAVQLNGMTFVLARTSSAK